MRNPSASNGLGFQEDVVYLQNRPDPPAPSNPNHLLVLGDMYANGLKLLYNLINPVACLANVTREAYSQLERIYTRLPDELTQNDLDSFDRIVEQMEFNTEIPFCVLGGLLAENGANTYFGLKIIHTLYQRGVRFEALLSVFDLECIARFKHLREYQKRQALPVDSDKLASLWEESICMGSEPTGSLNAVNNLAKLVRKGLRSPEAIESMMESYLASVELCTYSIESPPTPAATVPEGAVSASGTPAFAAPVEKKSTMVFFSAMPIKTLHVLGPALYEKWGLRREDFDASTEENLQKSIDHLRLCFRVWLRNATSDELKAMFENEQDPLCQFLQSNFDPLQFATAVELIAMPNLPDVKSIHGFHPAFDYDYDYDDRGTGRRIAGCPTSLSDDFGYENGDHSSLHYPQRRRYYVTTGQSPLLAQKQFDTLLGKDLDATIQGLQSHVTRTITSLQESQRTLFSETTAGNGVGGDRDRVIEEQNTALGELIAACTELQALLNEGTAADVPVASRPLPTAPARRANEALSRTYQRAMEKIQDASFKTDQAFQKHHNQKKIDRLNIGIICTIVGGIVRLIRAAIWWGRTGHRQGSWTNAAFWKQTKMSEDFKPTKAIVNNLMREGSSLLTARTPKPAGQGV